MYWNRDDGHFGKFRGEDPIRVAITSAPGFDATTIDQNRLTFGATGDEKSLLRCLKKGRDVKVDKVKDGKKDLICYFRPDVAGFKVGDVQARLKGATASEQIEGTAALKMMRLPKKKSDSWHKRHGVNPKYRPRTRN